MRATYEEGHEDKRDGCADEDRAERGHIPRHRRVLARPPEPEDANNEDRSRNHCANEALLRWWKATPLGDEGWVLAGEKVVDDRSDGGAEADADEGQAVLAEREAAANDEDDRERLNSV